MATLPLRVVNAPLRADGKPTLKLMQELGYQLVGRGKVRDTYMDPNDPNHLHSLATDRLSIFDFVLPCEVPFKGAVLAAITHFWLNGVLKDFRNHLVNQTGLDPSYPRERCLKVLKVVIEQFELIFRGYIGGSVWDEYQLHKTAGGHKLPIGMQRWQKLPKPIFTPSTKEEVDHDINVTAAYYFDRMGELGRRNIELLTEAYELVWAFAKQRGILILDTKLEIQTEPFILADEVCSPDSSRFTTVEDWDRAMAEDRDPIFYDKQPVRDWGLELMTPFGIKGLKKLKPSNPDHLSFVHNDLVVPSEIIDATSARYLNIFRMLVGMSLADYQRTQMDITN